MNSWQQPNTDEPGGGTWHKVSDPTTGWFASMAAGWTADRFTSATGGMEVDFSSVVPAGTRAVRVYLQNDTAAGTVFARKEGDANVTNTPSASNEHSHRVLTGAATTGAQVVLWLSATYKAELAVTSTSQDVYVAYPLEYLL